MNGNGIKWTILSNFDEYANDFTKMELASNEIIGWGFPLGKAIIKYAKKWLKEHKGGTYEIEIEDGGFMYNNSRIKLQAVEDFNLMDNAVFLEPICKEITDKTTGTEALTVRDFIEQLEDIARQYGDDMKVCFADREYYTFINTQCIFPYDRIEVEKEED